MPHLLSYRKNTRGPGRGAVAPSQKWIRANYIRNSGKLGEITLKRHMQYNFLCVGVMYSGEYGL
jgi:hypothetical protein